MLHVKEFREERGLIQKEVIAVIQERYPGYDKPLNSKVENPEKYGVRLVNDAEQMLEDAFLKTSPIARKPDKCRLPQRVQCRLSKPVYERLQQALKRDGYDTVQAGITAIIDRYLDERNT